MKYRYYFLLLLLIIPFTKVDASEKLVVDCSKSDKLYTCEVRGNFDYEISAIDFHYSLPADAKEKEYIIDERWIGSADYNWVSLYANENSEGNFPIMKIILESNKKITNEDITFTDLLVYDKYYEEHRIELNVNTEKKLEHLPIIIILCVIIILGIILFIIRKKCKRGDLK